MKNLGILLVVLFLSACSTNQPKNSENAAETSLREAFSGKFFMGAALKTGFEHNPNDINLVKHQFNSIVPENCMKSGEIHPKENAFFWDDADTFVAFGEENNMFIIGHCLVWHSQTPDWLFIDANGNDVCREVLIQRMKDHIFAVVGRYKGRVNGWDVVNEALEDDGSYRQSKWYNIIGEDFIELAFQFAHEADPDAELYYNDYSLNKPTKREGAVRLIQMLKEKNIKIDGIGMQAHYRFDFSPEPFEASIASFSETGLKVMITELDLSVLPWVSKSASANITDRADYREKYDPYTAGLPDSVASVQAGIYKDIFMVLLKHNEVISRVTFWGTNDGDSWKNDFPVKGRTDYPLLFDRDYQPKPAYYEIIKLVR
jgi:endo-1,4-beta-xylanase